MKRSTLSLLISAAILAAGLVAIWFLIVAPRLKPPTVAPPPPPTTGGETIIPTDTEDWHGALELYLTAPEKLPSGALRAELTLVKAVIVNDKGAEAKIFEGVRRVMLQEGTVEKALSELIPNGAWSRLKLEFSPAAEFSMPDGSVVQALVERRQAVLSFTAEVPLSRSLSLFARVPLEPELRNVGGAKTASLLPDPQQAESYVFGSFMRDQRGIGNLWTIPRPTLAEAVKADLGLDISTVMPGSQGFQAAKGAPAPVKPPL